MEADSEILDWENGDDELLQEENGPSLGSSGNGDNGGGDDPEDTISLGDDEEEQGYFYQNQDAPREPNEIDPKKEAHERLPSKQPRDDDMGANDPPRSYYRSRDDDHMRSFKARGRSKSLESTSRRKSSNQNPSPRTQQAAPRLTHALPPKPSVEGIYIPSSHSTRIEAVGMTSISPPSRPNARDLKKANGSLSKPDASPVTADHPQHWDKEKRYRQNNDTLYHSRETSEPNWNNSVSSLPSTSSLGASQNRRQRASPSGKTLVVPSDSNQPHSQTSRSNRDISYQISENDRGDSNRPLTPDIDGLSYKDRHYVPGSTVGGRGLDRPELASASSKGRYERSPPLSPPPARRRARSISPPPAVYEPQPHQRNKGYDSLRGTGRPRGRDVYTNDSVISREADPFPSESDRHWSASSRGQAVDLSRNDRGSRRTPRRENDEEIMYEQRLADDRIPPSLRRRENGRGPPRERDTGRPSDRDDRRERLNENQDFIPSPSYRSPPRMRERDRGPALGQARDYEYRQVPNDYPAPSSIRERPARYDYPPVSNNPPPPHEPPLPPHRPRDYERPQPVHPPRFEDRDYDRRRREPSPEPNLSRRSNAYPDESLGRRSYERDPLPPTTIPKRNEPPPEPASARRRQPLTPQTKVFLSAAASNGSYHRDPPSHVTAPSAKEGPSPTPPGWAYKDPTVPKGPRGEPFPDTWARDRQAARGRDLDRERRSPDSRPPLVDTKMDVDHDELSRPSAVTRPPPYDARGRTYEISEGPRSARGPQSARPGPDETPRVHSPPRMPPESDHPPSGLPSPYIKIEDRKNQDDNRPHWRDNRSSNSAYDNGVPRRDNRLRGGKTSPHRPARVTGTNNIPIGTRRLPSSLPPPPANLPSPPVQNAGPPHPAPFNPNARPPPSTLIDPTKARDLPPGKESYERPTNMEVPSLAHKLSFSALQSQWERPELPASNPSHTVETSGRAEDRPKRRRESRFAPRPLSDNNEQLLTIIKEPNEADETKDHENSNIGSREVDDHATPPPPSREPSAILVASQPANEVKPELERKESPQEEQQRTTGSNMPPELPSPESNVSRHGQKRNSRWGDNKKQTNDYPDHQPQTDLSSRMNIDPSPSLVRRMSSVPDADLRAAHSSSGVHVPTQNDVLTFKGQGQARADRPTLLDRLNPPHLSSNEAHQPSLRDRIVPSKRDRHDMLEDAHPSNASYEDDGNENKRVRRRSMKNRRGGRRNAT